MQKQLLALAVLITLFFKANLLQGQACSFTMISPDSSCLPAPILAYANDTAAAPPVTQRLWQLTDCVSGAVVFTSPLGLSPLFSYIPQTGGCYNLTMISTTGNGNCTAVKNNILVIDTPSVGIVSISPTSFCTPQTVTLTMNNSTSCGLIDLTRVQWGCGNITIDSTNLNSISHVYSGNCFPQCYDVVVVARSSCGCYSTKRVANAVCVQQPPRANFTVDISSGVCINNLTSHFTADSTGPGFTYCWFVNNVQRQCSNSRFFTNTFLADSNCYDIKLVVSNPSGCRDSLVRTDFVCVYSRPLLSFTQNATSACVDSGQSFELCLENTSRPFLPIEHFRIRGGLPVTIIDTIANYLCVLLTNPGTYNITLIGSYGPNCIDSITRTFVLHRAPTPCFYGDTTCTCHTQLTTRFTNCSTTPPGSTHIWSFGAASIPNNSTALNPLPVTYLGLGSRNVSLTVTAPNGCSRTLVKTGYINLDTLKPQLQVNPTSGCAPLEVTIYSITPPPALPCYSLGWCGFSVFEDSTNIKVDSISGYASTHTYTQPGCYDVRMTLASSTGCVSTIWKDNAFCIGTPQAGGRLNVSSNQICSSDSVTFAVSGPITWSQLLVHFGDEVSPPDSVTTLSGGVSIFNHTYAPGEYDVWIVPVLDGCPGDTLRANINVKPPLANFIAATSCLTGDLVSFQNLSIGANRYHWSFGCKSDTFNTASSSLILPHCDTCTVNLTAYNDTVQCTDKLTRTIQTVCTGVDASFSPDTFGSCGVSTNPTRFTNTTPGAASGVTRWYFGDSTGVRLGTSILRSFYSGVYHVQMIYTAPGGCVDTAFGLIANCDMHVDFSPTNICLPDSFHFHANAFDTVAVGGGCDSLVGWKWIFSNAPGDTSYEANPVHYFAQGNHTVTLIATNQYGCTATITKVVSAGTAVNTMVEIDTNICPCSTVCIINNTNSSVTLTETWQFPGSGSGSFSGHNPPCLTYNAAGDYPLIHSYTAGTCNQSDTMYMHVCPPKVSGYLTANHASCANPPLYVCGVNTSQCVDSTTDVYTWHFGNREYLEVNPCNFYTQPGNYPVTLTVATNNGCTDTAIIDTVIIEGPYVSSYTVSRQNVCYCDTVHFEASVVGAEAINVTYGCNMSFGSITPVNVGTVTNPTLVQFDVPYCLIGSCQPQLTMRDSSGCILLFNFPMVYIDTPHVDFQLNSNIACGPGNVCFTDSTFFISQPDSNSIADWSWTFGDGSGSVSTQQNPCHVYSQIGSYPVTLTVNSALGCAGTATKTFNLHGPPKANFSYQLTADTCNSALVCFTDLSAADTLATLTHWKWCYGDGYCDSSALADACHRYSSETTHPVTLTAIDEAGCVDDTTIIIPATPIRFIDARIGVTSTDSCNGKNICFTSTGISETTALTYYWSFNGQIYTSANFCGYYNSFNNRSAKLIVTDDKGCIDSIEDFVTVVLPDFNASFTYTVNSNVVSFTNTSQATNPATSQWQFGDGAASGSNNPTHTYAPGTYQVTLTISDAAGCQRQATQTITITAIDIKSIPAEPVEVSITPNPFSNFTTFNIKGAEGRYQLNLTTLLGQQVHTTYLNANEPYQLHRNKLAAGIYQYTILGQGKVLARGKIMVE